MIATMGGTLDDAQKRLPLLFHSHRFHFVCAVARTIKIVSINARRSPLLEFSSLLPTIAEL